jgi:hypothetical protein
MDEIQALNSMKLSWTCKYAKCFPKLVVKKYD